MSEQRPVVLFDLDYTLAALDHCDHTGAPQVIEPYPGVEKVLGRLAATCELAVVQPGVAPEAVRALLRGQRSVLEPFFRTDSLIFGGVTPDDQLLTEVATRLGSAGRTTVYVSPVRYRRWLGRNLGWRPCPHPRLAPGCLLDGKIAYCVLSGVADPGSDARSYINDVIRDRDVVPIKCERFGSRIKLQALAHATTIAQMKTEGTQIDIVRERVDDCDVFEITSGVLTEDEDRDLMAQFALLPHAERCGSEFLAFVPGDPAVELPHPATTPHGHTVLLEPGILNWRGPEVAGVLDLKPLEEGEKNIISTITKERFQTTCDPLWGGTALPSGKLINGRGSQNMGDNTAIVDHTIAVLSGALKNGLVKGVPFLDGLKKELRNVEARIPGTDRQAGIVILGAHLDSIANRSCKSLFQGSKTSEPGADDDASGMTAVLLAAEVLATLAAQAPPRREIRLVLFNAEEHGFFGSRRYAKALSSGSDPVPVAAMIQLDMIGWTEEGHPGSIEIHGARDTSAFSTLVDRSLELIQAIRDTADVSFPGHPIASPTSGAAGPYTRSKSDHKSFHAEGFTACWVSERGMQYLELGSAANGRCNPNYHSRCDRVVDYDLAAQITQIVIATAWRIAKA